MVSDGPSWLIMLVPLGYVWITKQNKFSSGLMCGGRDRMGLRGLTSEYMGLTKKQIPEPPVITKNLRLPGCVYHGRVDGHPGIRAE